MTKGFTYYYRLECFGGFRNNAIYEDRTFGGLYRKFHHLNSQPRYSKVHEFMMMYDSGKTGAYYNIHCILVNPDGTEKIIYTCEGLK